MKIKICGLTNLEDSELAYRFGADFLGFVFAKSPRKLAKGQAMKIFNGLPENALKVGVFVNEKIEKVVQYINILKLDFVQLHGDESDLYCRDLKNILNKSKDQKLISKDVGIIKSFRVKERIEYSCLKPYSMVDYYLFDTFSKKIYGGTGKKFNWSMLEDLDGTGKPIILSGGINPENIEEAMKISSVSVIDVSSGVEKSPGLKDQEKLEEVIKKAHEVTG